MEEKVNSAVKFCDTASTYLKERNNVLSNFSVVFEKAGKIVDTVAPWLGPIGIGLKVCTFLVGLFVRKKKG